MIEYKIMEKYVTTNPQEFWTFHMNTNGTVFITNSLEELKIKYAELLKTRGQSDLKVIQDLTVALQVEITDSTVETP